MKERKQRRSFPVIKVDGALKKKKEKIKQLV